MRRVHPGEGPVRLVANLALTTEEKGRGELRRWREAGWLGRTKSTEIVIPDLKKNSYRSGKAKMSLLLARSVRQCKELKPAGYFLTGYP